MIDAILKSSVIILVGMIHGGKKIMRVNNTHQNICLNWKNLPRKRVKSKIRQKHLVAAESQSETV